MNSQEYIEVSIRITPFSEENAEIVTAEICELPFESFSSEDPFLKCYIQKELYEAQALKVVLSGLEGMEFNVEFSSSLMPAVNWNAVWESQFTPIIVDGRCTIKASFHEGLKKTRFNITIDPKMAFGTGHHETTSSIINELLDAELEGKSVLDMGCGTSILAILASMRGANPVTAIDIDDWCVNNSRDNIELNGISNITVELGDANLLKGKDPFDVIIANINRNILLADMAQYAACMHAGSELYMSGFYVQDIPAIQEKAESLGMEFIHHREKNNWAAVKFIMK